MDHFFWGHISFQQTFKANLAKKVMVGKYQVPGYVGTHGINVIAHS
jgi:hypothetical protein